MEPPHQYVIMRRVERARQPRRYLFSYLAEMVTWLVLAVGFSSYGSPGPPDPGHERPHRSRQFVSR
jgi:hypothetical protein